MAGRGEGAACWVLMECPEGRILRESLEALSAGLSFQKQHRMETVVLWTGERPEDGQLERLASLGVGRMIRLEGPGNGTDAEEGLLIGLRELCLRRRPRYLLFGSSPLSLSLAPKLAALLDVGYVAGAAYLRMVGDTLSLTRPVLQGGLAEILRFSPPTHGLVSLYPRAFDAPADPSGERTERRLIPEVYAVLESQGGSSVREILEARVEPAEALDVEDAEVVVAGGKGMGSKGGFALLQELADCLGGAVAASRIAVDLGWAPKERLVGQTGKKVFPELYIACGISGAHQHSAGMKDARQILAINTDPHAPIFRIATWGILGDAVEVVREMIRQVREARGVVQ